MYNYGPIAATAVRLLAKFGRTVLLISETKGGTAYAPTLTTTSIEITAAIIGYTAKEIDGTLIQANDKILLTTSPVTLSNKVTDGAITYNIVSILEIKPGNTPILYKAQLRK